jgi:hypothetical protein
MYCDGSSHKAQGMLAQVVSMVTSSSGRYQRQNLEGLTCCADFDREAKSEKSRNNWNLGHSSV